MFTVTDLTRWPCDHREITRGNPHGAPTCMKCGEEVRQPYAEELTEVGIQLVIPGAERVQPASVKQLEMF